MSRRAFNVVIEIGDSGACAAVDRCRRGMATAAGHTERQNCPSVGSSPQPSTAIDDGFIRRR